VIALRQHVGDDMLEIQPFSKNERGQSSG
jgi:hypothetical protein